jgi:hypothetical protein
MGFFQLHRPPSCIGDLVFSNQPHFTASHGARNQGSPEKNSFSESNESNVAENTGNK